MVRLSSPSYLVLGDDHLLSVVLLLIFRGRHRVVVPGDGDRAGLEVRHAVTAVLLQTPGLPPHPVTDLVTLQHYPGGLLLLLPG